MRRIVLPLTALWPPRRMPASGMASRRSVQAGIDRLSHRGVTAIVAVPLFVSWCSSVITSTENLLGLRPEIPRDLAIFSKMDHRAHGAPASDTHAERGAPAADPTRPWVREQVARPPSQH